MTLQVVSGTEVSGCYTFIRCHCCENRNVLFWLYYIHNMLHYYHFLCTFLSKSQRSKNAKLMCVCVGAVGCNCIKWSQFTQYFLIYLRKHCCLDWISIFMHLHTSHIWDKIWVNWSFLSTYYISYAHQTMESFLVQQNKIGVFKNIGMYRASIGKNYAAVIGSSVIKGSKTAKNPKKMYWSNIRWLTQCCLTTQIWIFFRDYIYYSSCGCILKTTWHGSRYLFLQQNNYKCKFSSRFLCVCFQFYSSFLFIPCGF